MLGTEREQLFKKKKKEASSRMSHYKSLIISLGVVFAILVILDLLCIFVWDLQFKDTNGNPTSY